MTSDRAGERPAFTLKEAAERCSVSLSTIRRRHEAGKFPQAYKGSEGEWRVPVENLLAAGFSLGRSVTNRPEQARSEQKSEAHDQPIQEHVTWLREQVGQAERRAAVAEALAEERREALARADREVDGLQQALRILNPGPVQHDEHQNHEHRGEGQANEPPPMGSRRPGWLQRLRGQR